jgi:probable rRNA maturation factor
MVKRSIHLSVVPDYRSSIRRSWLRQVAKTALEVADPDGKTAIGVVITDDATLRNLNSRFRGFDEVTDVLSFNVANDRNSPAAQQFGGVDAFPNTPEELEIDGEVIISYPQAVRQAKEHGVRDEEEIALLVIHGILHLLGHDHLVRSEETIMKALEAQALSQVFASAAAPQEG